MHPRVQTIIDGIRAAFPESIPPARPITGHRCDECDEVDRLMGGRTWTSVADKFPQTCHDTFPLLTAEAKAYYLPAYMCFEVASPGWMAGTSIALAFERGDFTPTQFDERQRAVIADWLLAYYRSEPDGVVPRDIASQWTMPVPRPSVRHDGT